MIGLKIEDVFAAHWGTPTNDDCDRVICPEAGKWGHWQCGLCEVHNKPRFMCGCLHNDADEPKEEPSQVILVGDHLKKIGLTGFLTDLDILSKGSGVLDVTNFKDGDLPGNGTLTVGVKMKVGSHDNLFSVVGRLQKLIQIALSR